VALFLFAKVNACNPATVYQTKTQKDWLMHK